MTKLRMDPAELRIDSFPTAAPVREAIDAVALITQGAQTCYDCTRFACSDTRIC
jgi:hypothetical protein